MMERTLADPSGTSPEPMAGGARDAFFTFCLCALFCFYVLAHFYSLIFGIAAFSTGNIIQIGLAAFLIELFFFHRKQALAYFIVFVVLSGYLASALFYSRGLTGDVALILANGGMLLVLLRRRISVPIIYLVFLGYAGYFLYGAITGRTPNDMLAGPNGVSWVMIQAVVLLYVVLDKENRKISLLPAMLVLVLCIWASGRSGIVSSGLLAIGIAALYLRQNRLVLAALALALIGLLAGGLLQPLADLIGSYFWYFDELGFNPHDRDVLFNYYWGQLDATSLLLGFDLTRDAFWQLWGLNPHNSYLFMHSYLGFAAFILMGLILGAVLRSFFCRNKIYCLLLFVLLLRAATDPIFFLSPLDFLVYYLVVRIYDEPAPAIARMWSAVAHRALETQ